jgi:adenylate cyclase
LDFSSFGTGSEANVPTSRARGLQFQRILPVIGIYCAAGWGILEFIDWSSGHFGFSGRGTELFLIGWLLGLPLIMLLAARRRRSAEPVAEQAGSPSAVGSADPAVAVADAGGPAATVAATPSVAVLPLTSLSAAAEDVYLSSGITDEIVNTLGRLQGLRVASRTSAAAYGDRARDVREVGRSLGVDAVLEGSLQRAGGRLRVNTQLVDVRSGHNLWSERFDTSMDDVFAVEDRIAENVAGALRVILRDQDRAMIARSPTRNVAAYEHYLRGRQFLYQTRRKSLLYARDMFLKATALDATFTVAWGGIAEANALLRMYYPGEGDAGEAKLAAAKALDLEPDLGEAHSAQGAALFMAGALDDAERAFRTAIRLDRRLFEPRYLCARVAFQRGRFEEAARLFAEALDVREDYQAAFFAAQSREALGETTAAAAAYTRALEVVQRHMELNPDDARAATMRAVALCRLGRTAEGFEWAERAIFADPEDAGVRYNVACLYAVGGAADRALDCLDSAVTAGFGNREWLERDPDLESVRGLPRFDDLLSRM